MNVRTALLIAGMMGLPAAANAQMPRGPYVSFGAGVNFMQQEPIESVNGTTLNGVNLNANTGAAGVGAFGWSYGNGLRAELELDYRYNSLSRVSGPGGAVSIGGNEQKFGPMVNMLYDFSGVPLVTPYVGLGVGYQWARDTVSTIAGSATQTEGAFAYQAIVGGSIPVTSNIAVTAEYRFLGLAGDRTYSGVRLGNDFNHAILFGARFSFGQAPAPVVPQVPTATPAPPVQPSRSYLVFFDWDKATLTDRARGIIKEAAEHSTQVQYTRIDVSGYTDTSGTPQYNQGLSIKRAQTVAAELVRDGVPQNAITAQGFGDTHLLVSTGPGVREPQNRRVEIVIH
jgi:outer membrane protein OmpA-like peptidoglycan-associated protein